MSVAPVSKDLLVAQETKNLIPTKTNHKNNGQGKNNSNRSESIQVCMHAQ
jgi:hypothetical protein